MTITFLDKYLRTVKNHNVTLTMKSQDLLTFINSYLTDLSVPSEAISVVNETQEKYILFPPFNLKLICKNRLVFSDHEPFQEISFVISNEPEIEVIKVFFSVEGRAHLNHVPEPNDVGFELIFPDRAKEILDNILQRLYDLDLITAKNLD
ncbi:MULTISPECIES: hypothetical protein [unclassified Tatumella]|uniref:hypothetical protein n=1 Tax=unclassified Tatumella TaxID=2649542 RepID=UPI001BAE83AB|nr:MULTISPECIES: hypothetical protein [unclassified Tatumella]MBS0878403.1 hypothetical protein [Tatumella sp. JGM82]MBS0891199.1 hypothetical protein [Tatumella sp. JGM94]MBS0902756.1 hypothetical protein [Tatumella sp. JGM100]